jgi:hypothetical protein
MILFSIKINFGRSIKELRKTYSGELVIELKKYLAITQKSKKYVPM